MLISYQKESTWACACCSNSFGWVRANTRKIGFVYDRAPFEAKVDGTSYPACSQECARTLYIGKALELVHESKKLEKNK